MDGNSISSTELLRLIGRPTCPVVVDVRREPAFQADGRVIAGALRGVPEDVDAWAGKLPPGDVAVYCVRGHEVSREAATALRRNGIAARFLEGGIEAWRAAGGATVRRSDRTRRVGDPPTRWVTRARPKIDRIACPWLVRRFVDREAVFRFVPAERVLAVAGETGDVPFDIPGVPYGHEGEECSFDAFLRLHGIEDPALRHLAAIVRGADTARPDLSPEAPGLLALSLGLSALIPEDDAMLESGMLLYDALYAWARGPGAGLPRRNPLLATAGSRNDG